MKRVLVLVKTHRRSNECNDTNYLQVVINVNCLKVAINVNYLKVVIESWKFARMRCYISLFGL